MSRKKMSEETKAAMEFAAAMGLKGYKGDEALEDNADMEFAYAMGLRHDLGSFRARKKAKKEAFQPEVSFSFT